MPPAAAPPPTPNHIRLAPPTNIIVAVMQHIRIMALLWGSRRSSTRMGSSSTPGSRMPWRKLRMRLRFCSNSAASSSTMENLAISPTCTVGRPLMLIQRCTSLMGGMNSTATSSTSVTQ